jgi:ribosome-binding factor A
MSHKEFHRTDRVAAQLRREVATLVHELVREHALPSVSVSDVEVTRDMAHASVWVTALLPDQAAPAVKLLNEAAKEMRRELSRVLKLRMVPELHFKYDDSVDKGERIEQLLRENPAKPEE